MNKKEILRWSKRIIIIIALVFLIEYLSDKFGRGRVILNGLAIVLLLYSIGKLLLKK